MKRELLEALQSLRGSRGVAIVATELASGRQGLFDASANALQGDLELDPELEAHVREVARAGRSARVDHAGAGYFLHLFEPPLRLAIVGAVHIAQPLVRMARELGHAITLVDPRHAWASEERFPGVAIDRRWPDEALRALAIDARTAIVTLTHDPKLDDPALEVALSSDAFYVGALGSRRTQARRLERLRELGVDEAVLGRIHGPIGLDIGAVSPAEIAVSIVAEITQVLRARREPAAG